MRKLVAILAVVAAVAYAGGAGARIDSTVVKSTEKEFKLTAAPGKVKAGSVTFSVKNNGHLKHEFIVLKTNLSKLPVKGATAVLAGKVYGKIPQFGPGVTKSLTVKLPPGRYILLCNVPAHYAAGQHIAFTVSS